MELFPQKHKTNVCLYERENIRYQHKPEVEHHCSLLIKASSRCMNVIVILILMLGKISVPKPLII